MSVVDGACVSEEVTDPERLRLIEQLRRAPEFRFSGVFRRAVQSPAVNYEVAFARKMHPLVRVRLDRLLERARANIAAGRYGDRRGYIYVFHDLADGNNVVKIGRTVREPHKRVAEWNRELVTESGERRQRNVVLLFAYPTLANEFAERVVHEALRCEHIGNRLSVASGNELSEFFRIANFRALKLFLRQTLAYVDRFVFGARRRR
jgi:hypothetical protein